MKTYARWLMIAAMVTPSVAALAQTLQNLQPLTPYQKLSRDIFQELIEINTTRESGSTKAAEAMAARLRSAGFADTDIQLVGPQPEHMNLVVRYRGKGTLAPILLIGHLDVVEARREDWSFDPFKFLESGGYFYGRGTTDMKNNDVALVAGLVRLRQEGFLPNRDIIVALTDGEEGGDYNGVRWLIASRRDLIDAEYCINPDGGGGDIQNGRETVMLMQTSEKVYLDAKLEVHNKGGHSSLPVKDNAIYRLAEALTRLARFDFPISLNETTRAFFERSAAQETGQTKADMLAMARIPTDMAAANRLANDSPYYNSKMRTTCVATMLSGGHADNALPQTARANVNCRLLPDDDPGKLLATLKEIIADTEVAVTVSEAAASGPRSPIRKDVLEILERITASMWPEAVVTPDMSTGATDGKSLRTAGIPVYGISGMFTDVHDVRAHGRDERMGVKEFYNGVEFLYRLIKALTSR